MGLADDLGRVDVRTVLVDPLTAAQAAARRRDRLEPDARHARLTAQAVAQARAVRAEGCSPGRTPFGFDKVYVRAEDGTPVVRVRRQDDGSELHIDPVTERVLRQLPAGCSLRYFKQDGCRATLVAGRSDRVAAVRLIFQRQFVDGWTHRRIAAELAAVGAPRPAGGGQWSRSMVCALPHATLYVGRAVLHRQSKVFTLRQGGDTGGGRPAGDDGCGATPAGWRAVPLPGVADAFVPDDALRSEIWRRQLASLRAAAARLAASIAGPCRSARPAGGTGLRSGSTSGRR